MPKWVGTVWNGWEGINVTSAQLQLDEISVDARNGKWSNWVGVHSGKSLTAIELSVVANGPDEVAIIRRLTDKQEVDVIDPMTGRQYRARVRSRSESSSDRSPRHNFQLTVKEVDMPPSFSVLEIEDVPYDVIGYEESELKGAVAWYALLRLTEDKLSAFRQAVALDRPVSVRRVGVDGAAAERTVGGILPWSIHAEAGRTFYKQVARFFPLEHEVDKGIGRAFASGLVQTNLIAVVMEAQLKLQILIAALGKSGGIDAVTLDVLTSDKWRERLDDRHRADIGWRLQKVDDAADDHL